MAPDPVDDVVVRPFADFIREIDRGSLHDELSEKLHELVTAVEDTAKGGTITLTLGVKPVEKGNAEAILVAGRVTTKRPETPRKPSIFFSDHGNLVRTDPNQLTFEGIRDVSMPDEERERDARQRAAGSDA